VVYEVSETSDLTPAFTTGACNIDLKASRRLSRLYSAAAPIAKDDTDASKV
jgi:hypothetical protein